MMTDADAVFYLFLSEFPWVQCWLITKLAIWWPTIKISRIKCLAQEQGTLLGSSDGCMYVEARCCMGQWDMWRLEAADSRQLTQFVDPRADKCH